MDDKLNKCNKCDKPAEYTSPELLCGDHWAEWWVSDFDAETQLTTLEREQLGAEVTEFVARARKSAEDI